MNESCSTYERVMSLVRCAKEGHDCLLSNPPTKRYQRITLHISTNHVSCEVCRIRLVPYMIHSYLCVGGFESRQLWPPFSHLARDMTRAYVEHDAFICEAVLMHMPNATRSYLGHDSFVSLDMTFTYEGQDVCIDMISMVQRVAMRCSVLQCVAVCCSVLQCVAVWCSTEFDNGDTAEYDRYGAAYCNAL